MSPLRAAYLAVRRCLSTASNLTYLIEEIRKEPKARIPGETDFGYSERQELPVKMANDAVGKLREYLPVALAAIKPVEPALALAFPGPAKISGRAYASFHHGAYKIADTVFQVVELARNQIPPTPEETIPDLWRQICARTEIHWPVIDFDFDEVDVMMQKEAIAAALSVGQGGDASEPIRPPLELTIAQIADLAGLSKTALEHATSNRPNPVRRGPRNSFLFAFSDAARWIELEFPTYFANFPATEQEARRRLANEN